jgi:hypothetical protein
MVNIIEEECQRWGMDFPEFVPPALRLVENGEGKEVSLVQDEDLVWDRVKQARRERFERGEPRHPQDELQAVQDVLRKAVRSALVIDSFQMETFVSHLTAVVYSEGVRKIY